MSSRDPTFSVIVPTYRRPQALARCLSSLARQTWPHDDYEVIVVDDAAMPEDVGRVVATAGLPARRLLSQARRGAAGARNAGASVARGRLLAFIDDDCQAAPDWLERLERHMAAAREPALVGGRVVNALAHDPFASASQALVDFLCDAFNRVPGQARILTSNNLCVPARSFYDAGGFDTAFTGAGGEDREFCLRWAHTGRRSFYAPDAVVQHAHAMTLSEFLRQHYAYGRGAALLRERALAHGYGPLPLERVSFYWELLRYPQRASGSADRWRQSVLFALSQVANAAGYFRVGLAGTSNGPQATNPGRIDPASAPDCL